jgi:hypothetical protein
MVSKEDLRLIRSLVFLFAIVGTQQLVAQRLQTYAPVRNDQFLAHGDWLTRSFSHEAEYALSRRPDHAYEGAVVGMILIGGGAALLGHSMCRSSELDKNCTWEATKFGLVGSFGGGILGALIGGAFPKRSR